MSPMSHHPSCPARTPYVPAVACICPPPALTAAQRRTLRRLDPDRPIYLAGLVVVLLGLAAGLLGLAIVAGLVPAPAWSVLA